MQCWQQATHGRAHAVYIYRCSRCGGCYACAHTFDRLRLRWKCVDSVWRPLVNDDGVRVPRAGIV